ncbi:Mth938-like domain-containing protein [Lysobacter ciconiae]|uniref:Mth938-like domain-containing protein n=1 Tax=Novilysobacter ciconiae TaxID=2781022 RepID=A0A7S6ZST5_9GAMM|nr:Mth938-like domain-containing protein [Lysobacter ciconiae]QOW20207.1 Mth938-like domain-containing protein [Lysobacter ciconiae]
MELTLERPDYEFFLRAADGNMALVNDRRLTRSFVLTPNHLSEDWGVRDIHTLTPSDLDPLLALEPEVVIIGGGGQQVFAPAQVMAVCLRRGIGIEVMTNSAAARTFSVLASENRRVVAGFVLPG